jgi:hypothetical protein
VRSKSGANNRSAPARPSASLPLNIFAAAKKGDKERLVAFLQACISYMDTSRNFAQLLPAGVRLICAQIANVGLETSPLF